MCVEYLPVMWRLTVRIMYCHFRKQLKKPAEVKILLDDPTIIDTIGSFTIQAKSNRAVFIPIHSKHMAGHCILSFSSDSKELEHLYKIKIGIKVGFIVI